MNELKFDHDRFDAGEMPTQNRKGERVVKVVDSGLDVDYPLAVWLDSNRLPYFVTRAGWNSLYDNTGTDPLDLVHEPKMRKVRVMVYRHMGDSGTVTTLSSDSVSYGTSKATALEAGRFITELEVEVEA